MRSIRKQIEIAVAVLAMGIGCNSPSGPIPAAGTSEASPRRGGVARFASFADIRTIDPANIADGVVPAIDELLFAGIVDFGRDGQVIPDIAERFETSADGISYRFILRHGVLFHDGTELHADDIKRSVERALAPDSPNPQISLYDRIDGFEAFTKGKEPHLSGVTTEGDYVVVFRLREPDATFLTLLAMQSLRPVCKSAGEHYSDQWQPCGAGPFKLRKGDWDPGRGLRLVRHEGYFKAGLPHVDTVEWTFHMNMSTQYMKFLAGQLDILEDIQQGNILAFQSDPRWRPFWHYKPETQIGGESMNTEMPPFDNVDVRRAVSFAIDRRQFALIKATNMTPNTRPFPPGFPGVEAFEGQTYDYQKALEYMAKAGFAYDPKTGEGGYPHVVPYVVYRQGLHEYGAQVLAQQLARIGIRLEVRLVNYPSYFALTHRRKSVPISPQGWQQEFPDPSNFLDPLYHSRTITEEDSNNTAFYKNTEVDRLLDAARRELSPPKRTQIYAEAERRILDDAPWAYTFSYRWFEVHQPALRGYVAHPMWAFDVREAWLDRKEDQSPLSQIVDRRFFAELAKGVR